MRRTKTGLLVTASALVLGLTGIALVFLPQETAILLGGNENGALGISLWGSALFGFGAMNWTARHSALGGIYGRAVVAGNQAHAFVGAILLGKLALAAGLDWPVATLFTIYLLHAALFTYLMFWSTGLD